jgi:CubicO group peptidase (beta-lactamase class C family)
MTRHFFWILCFLLSSVSSVFAEGVFPGAEWQTDEPANQGVDAAGLEKAKEWLGTHNSKSGLVIRHGRIIAEWYFGDANQNSQFACYSTSKSLSSMATGLAIEAGKLALDQTVGQYVSDASPESKKTITVQQLLSMTSGVHNNPNVPTREDLFTYVIKEAPMDFEPGTKWDYNNTGLALLSPVFHKATGKQIDEYLNEHVFKQIGIPADDWKWEHREGLAIPYSGCHMTARSMGRIGLMVLNEGKWSEKQIVPVAWLKESTSPSQKLNETYGYLWWNNKPNKWPNVPQDAFAALGRWDNDIFVVPSLNLVVIRQSDLEPGKGHNIAEYLQFVCDAVKKE